MTLPEQPDVLSIDFAMTMWCKWAQLLQWSGHSTQICWQVGRIITYALEYLGGRRKDDTDRVCSEALVVPPIDPAARVDKDQAGTLHTSRTNLLTEYIDVSFNPESLPDNQSFFVLWSIGGINPIPMTYFCSFSNVAYRDECCLNQRSFIGGL